MTWVATGVAVGGTALYGGYKGYSGHQASEARKKAYVPEAPEFKQAPALFDDAIGFAKENTPYEYGSRESALQDIWTPESTTDYYSKFQPTSFEDALSNQYFANTWPGVEREIYGAQSRTGLEYSPATAKLLGDARGQVGYDIGSYLSQQAGGRADMSLEQRLQFDPRQTYDRYLQTDMLQSNMQEAAEYERAKEQAAMDYWKATGKADDKTQTAGSITNVLLAALQGYGQYKGAQTMPVNTGSASIPEPSGYSGSRLGFDEYGNAMSVFK